MDKIVIEATGRDVIGKKVKLLRNEGKLPAVIYGKDQEPIAITLDHKSATRILRDVSRASVLTIDVEGKEYTALVRDRQREVLSGEYIHVDFLAISLTETVRTQVNIFIDGVSPAVEEFMAVVMTGLDSIEVEALPTDLPESITVDISGLENIGDTILVRDLVLPKGVECLSEPDDMLVVITAQAAEEVLDEVEELEEDLDLEPEVIGDEEEVEGEEAEE
jgi:large subunit ribosomal protein L25